MAGADGLRVIPSEAEGPRRTSSEFNRGPSTSLRYARDDSVVGGALILPPLPPQLRLNLPQRQTIHHVGFREPAFARDPNPEP